MQFGNWKKWINKFVKNNNDDKKEKSEELQDPPSTAPSSISTELLQPSQEITRKNVTYNNDGTVRLFPINKNMLARFLILPILSWKRVRGEKLKIS
jgi:hypothetical protein